MARAQRVNLQAKLAARYLIPPIVSQKQWLPLHKKTHEKELTKQYDRMTARATAPADG